MEYVGSHREPRPAYLRLPVLGAAAGVLVTAIAGVVAMNVIGTAPDYSVNIAYASAPLYGFAGTGFEAVDVEVERFVDKCQKSVDTWRAGQISWPPDMDIDVGESVTYQVAADIRTAPLPADVVLGVDDAKSAPVAIRCAISARLVPVDTSVEVKGGDIDNGGWRPRVFDASGVLEWSWTVRAKELGTHQLRLELKPVAQSTSYQFLDEGQTFTRVTPMQVSGTTLQRIGAQVESAKGLLSTLAGLLLVTILGILGGAQKVVEAWLAFRKSLAARHTKRKSTANPDAKASLLDDDPFPKLALVTTLPAKPKKAAAKQAATRATKKTTVPAPAVTVAKKTTLARKAAKRAPRKATPPAVVDLTVTDKKDARKAP